MTNPLLSGLGPLAIRLAESVDSILEAAEYLVADGDAADADMVNDALAACLDVVSPVDLDGEPLDAHDRETALPILDALLRDAIRFQQSFMR